MVAASSPLREEPLGIGNGRWICGGKGKGASINMVKERIRTSQYGD